MTQTNPRCPNMLFDGRHMWEIMQGRYDRGEYHTVSWLCSNCGKVTKTSVMQPSYGRTDRDR